MLMREVLTMGTGMIEGDAKGPYDLHIYKIIEAEIFSSSYDFFPKDRIFFTVHCDFRLFGPVTI